MKGPAAMICLLLAAGAQAQPGRDLLDTPSCKGARERFERLLEHGARGEPLAAARRETALACFGQEPASQPNDVLPRPVPPAEPIRLRPAPGLTHRRAE